MMRNPYVVSVYDIESSTKLFTIYLATRRIFTANICAWLSFSSPFPGAIGGFKSANLRFYTHYFKAWYYVGLNSIAY